MADLAIVKSAGIGSGPPFATAELHQRRRPLKRNVETGLRCCERTCLPSPRIALLRSLGPSKIVPVRSKAICISCHVSHVVVGRLKLVPFFGNIYLEGPDIRKKSSFIQLRI